MRTGISLTVSSIDGQRLTALIRDRNARQKHVWRAEIVLLSADGAGTIEIMRRTGKSKTCVWRWQERFATEGFEGLLRYKTRPPRIAPLGPEIAERVVALTRADPPGETTHWTADMMAAQVGISASAVRRIWKAHGLQPNRWRQFKLSNDPQFVGKLRDVVGLYVDPPAHAIVLSLDEKSQIQALDRTQPGLPMKKGRLGTMTHDYKRHGTTTLFAAFNVLDNDIAHLDQLAAAAYSMAFHCGHDDSMSRAMARDCDKRRMVATWSPSSQFRLSTLATVPVLITRLSSNPLSPVTSPTACSSATCISASAGTGTHSGSSSSST